jgi:hypothetical protein
MLFVILAAPSLCTARNQIDNFELRCTSADTSASPHTFHIDIPDDGEVTFSQPSVSPAKRSGRSSAR